MKPLLAVGLVVLFEGLAFGAVLPVVSYHCQSLGGGPVAVGLMFALVSGPKVLTNPLFGRLSDHFGRRPALAVATLGTLAGSIGWAIAPTAIWLGAARTITGLFGAQAGLAQAVAADVTPPERRAASIGLLGAAFGLAITFGPLIGGEVGARFGNAAVGWACALLQVLSLLVIAVFLPETRPADPGESSGAASGDRRFWLTTRGLLSLLAVTLLVTVATSEMVPTFALVLERGYGFAERQTGYAWAFFGLIGVAVQGGLIRPLVASLGERATIAVGLLTLAAGFGLIAVEPAQAAFWLATALAAVGTALVTPALASLLSRSVGADVQGSLAGVYQAVLGLGRAGGNYLGGGLYARFATAGPYVSAAALSLVALAVLLRWPPPRREREAETPVGRSPG
jgi:DHA1 family tetracycline resistance protein-like MFS transporter